MFGKQEKWVRLRLSTWRNGSLLCPGCVEKSGGAGSWLTLIPTVPRGDTEVETKEPDFLPVEEGGGGGGSQWTKQHLRWYLKGENWLEGQPPRGMGVLRALCSVSPVPGIFQTHYVKEWTGIAAKTKTPSVFCYSFGFWLSDQSVFKSSHVFLHPNRGAIVSQASLPLFRCKLEPHHSNVSTWMLKVSRDLSICKTFIFEFRNTFACALCLWAFEDTLNESKG